MDIIKSSAEAPSEEGEYSKENYGYDDEGILTLEFNDGTSEACGILGVFDALGREYIVLQSLNPSEENVVYLRRFVRYSDGSFEVFDITDEEEFKRVEAKYKELDDPMPVEDMVLMDWIE